VVDLLCFAGKEATAFFCILSPIACVSWLRPIVDANLTQNSCHKLVSLRIRNSIIVQPAFWLKREVFFTAAFNTANET